LLLTIIDVIKHARGSERAPSKKNVTSILKGGNEYYLVKNKLKIGWVILSALAMLLVNVNVI